MKASEAVKHYFDKAADKLDVHDEMRQLMFTPKREIQVQIPVEMDDGSLNTYFGYRVQHDNSRGPMKGGLRYHHEVDLADDLEDCTCGHPLRWRKRRGLR